MNKKTKIGIVLLAAGSSSRMGSNKLKYVHNGITLLENAIQSGADSNATDLVVVTGANRAGLGDLIQNFSVDTVWNEHWEKGIGSSIKCGLRHLIHSSDEKPEAVIISVCDQPFITVGIFNKLIETYHNEDKTIIVSEYNNSYGVPVLYDESFFEKLSEIPDEYGAKKFVVDHAPKEQVGKIPFPKGEIDIDTIEDLEKITRS